LLYTLIAPNSTIDLLSDTYRGRFELQQFPRVNPGDSTGQAQSPEVSSRDLRCEGDTPEIPLAWS